jgi:hypothetical protein
MAEKKDKKPPAANPQAHKEDLLDEALKDSFPASDPPAVMQPKQHP